MEGFSLYILGGFFVAYYSVLLDEVSLHFVKKALVKKINSFIGVKAVEKHPSLNWLA